MEEERLARLVTIGVLVVATLVGVVLVSLGPHDDLAAVVPTAPLGGRAGGRAVAPATPSTAVPVTTAGDAGTTTTAPTSTTTAADPGALPQTDERPAAGGATFTAAVLGLWQAVQQDRPALAIPFFFPKAAYLQVKAISDPAADYEQRLIADYAQDVHTLHAQLGADAAGAQFAGIDVPDAQAVLVQPGEESNKLSYWRVYGTTLHYAEDGQAGSFPVTSLISWRGQWYVVHLGEIR